MATAASPAAAWDGFQVIVWQGQTAAGYATLRGLGVSAARVLASRDDLSAAAIQGAAAPALAGGLGIYVENVGTDFYAAYHRWQGGGVPVNAAFLALQRRHERDPGDGSVFRRSPSLQDPVWRGRVSDRMAAHVRALRTPPPLFYSLADEPGIADLAAPWDFDRGAASVAAFRGWLQEAYGSLAALDLAWGTRHDAWAEVLPPLTSEAMRAPGENFAGWSDFRAFMDAEFAAALRAGTDLLHRADPAAFSAIEGGQRPGWGGWDYARLTRAVDLIELGDLGPTIDIVRGLAPRLPLLTTLDAGLGGDELAWRTWRAALRGLSGVILWDERGVLLGEEGRRMAPVWQALRGPLGRRLAGAVPSPDPVAVLASQASFRVRWMLDHRSAGDAWTAIGAAGSLADDAGRAAQGWIDEALSHAGWQPAWLSDEALETGVPAAIRVIVLPDALALSDVALAALRGFAAGGGVILSTGPAGTFDGHGRRREVDPALPVTEMREGAALLRALRMAGLVPRAAPPTGAPVTLRVLEATDGLIVGALPDRGAGQTATTLFLDRLYRVRDLRSGALLGRRDRVSIPISPDAPAVLLLQP